MRRLVLVACLVVVAGCGGGGGEPASQDVTTAPQVKTTTNVVTIVVTETTDPGASPIHARAFRTPSNNIGCAVSGGALRCDILTGLRPEPSGSCELDWAGLTMDAMDAPKPQCAGDTVFQQGSPVLAYGRSWTRGAFVCHSRRTGLECSNRGERGFVLARASWRTF